MRRRPACLLAALATLTALAPAAEAHVLRMTFVHARSTAIVRTVVAKQHASGGHVTTCYRISQHAARCGFKTWRTGAVRWTCLGHVDVFFAPASSTHVSVLTRGAVCR
jgi:hypothetical protein